ncbi:ribulokinase [Draconibacterium orientale]|uniref:ribulokinase n=1 Tax=Draconibacterium orientale TaxID=1168034 RepID=UPI002ABE5160|nr:ribulokinase [Draconibacterium orientale]
MRRKYVLGVDFGTDSCRVIIVDTASGDTMASAVKYYTRWKNKLYCNPEKNQFRQHPLDYIESFEQAASEVIRNVSADIAASVVGIAFATTSSTVALTDNQGIPLAMTAGLEENPNAMFVLWKDHTAGQEADEINALLAEEEINYCKYSGGRYSSEWGWAKVLHLLRTDMQIREKAGAWIEHCDWMPNMLCGKKVPSERKYSRCASGHKAMWHESWGGLPPKAFFEKLDPLFGGLQTHFYNETYTSDTPVGNLSDEWAQRLGLSTDVIVAVGAVDCHVGAVGAQIEPGVMVSVIGTSSCDIMVAEKENFGRKVIPGICGQVDGSVVPGYIGFEAGQPAFGDLYAWFKNLLLWPLSKGMKNIEWLDKDIQQRLQIELEEKLISSLSESAEKIQLGCNALLATDWINGRRSPDSDESLKAAISGLEIGSDAPHIFRALVEATVFGLNAIVERFAAYGLNTDKIVATGGIAQKSPFIMQVLADVTGLPVQVAATTQAVALGSAMFAAVAAGLYSTMEEAQKEMGQGYLTVYQPNNQRNEVYRKLYSRYSEFGGLLVGF